MQMRRIHFLVTIKPGAPSYVHKLHSVRRFLLTATRNFKMIILFQLLRDIKKQKHQQQLRATWDQKFFSQNMFFVLLFSLSNAQLSNC